MRDKEFITTMAASNAIGIAATSVRTSLLNLIHSRLSCDSKMWFIWFIASWFICLFVDLYLFIFLFILLFIHTHKLKRLRAKVCNHYYWVTDIHFVSWFICLFIDLYLFIFLFIILFILIFMHTHICWLQKAEKALG